MLNTPFLTQLDSRAAIKGSRDPLGIQPIWARLGRQVVGNLTTVSTSVPNFTVLLLGYYFAEQAAKEGGASGDLATFLKWEQVAAYVRAHVNKDESFRGVERVRRRLADSLRVPLGTESAAQILSNQRTYGLWGLYTVPSRASGLIEGEPSRLTPVAYELIVSSMIPVLKATSARAERDLLEILKKDSYQLDLRDRSRDHAVVQGVARLLSQVRGPERTVYRKHLLEGESTGQDPSRGTQGRQRELAALLIDTLDETDWQLSPDTMLALVAHARARGEHGDALADRLDAIRNAEALLAPAAALFEYVLGANERTPSEIAESVRKHWTHVFRGTLNLDAVRALEEPLCAGGDPASGKRWVQIAAALRDAAYEEVIRLLLTQNEVVMRARSAGAAWATLRDGKLHVRFRDSTPAQLPSAPEIPHYWRHAYFIDAARSIAMGVCR